MLQFKTKGIDICRISKLLARYSINARITSSVITLNGNVSDELLTQLGGDIDINSVQNFISEEPLYLQKTVKSEASIQTKNSEKVGTTEQPHALLHNISEYNLIYSEVKRGEVYMCDFGEPYGREQGYPRYAIVVQNNYGNLYSDTTIVVPCTTAHKKDISVHLKCTFSSSNMIDYDLARVGSKENVILPEQIRVVDKRRLRKYLGELTPDFMKIIDDKINFALYLRKKDQKECKNVNIIQVQLLSFIDINELLKISQSNSTAEVKARKILDLFGFDFNRNGVQYLLQAIIASPKDDSFNIETLSQSVSQEQEEVIDKEEIKRLMIARVKERFNFRQSPTIEFIRLVNNFIGGLQ